MLEVVAKTGYIYLLALAFAALWRACSLGLAVDRAGKCLHPILHAVHLLILLLCIVQVYQCVTIILGPVSARSWWIPLVCKQSSLIFYHCALWFMRWRLRNIIDVPSRTEV